jgi:hypothetical protein
MYGMRRLIFAVALLTAATAAAFNTATRPVRIAMLATPAPSIDAFRDRLHDELHALGYDVSDSNVGIRDIGEEAVRADYYVEILDAAGDSRPVAGIGAGPVDLGVSVSHVAASINIYDGRTLKLFDTIDLHQRNTNLSPAGIYLGGRPVWAAIALPVFERSHVRNAMRKLARDTARQIDEAVRR